jgi:hypothetical protein
MQTPMDRIRIGAPYFSMVVGLAVICATFYAVGAVKAQDAAPVLELLHQDTPQPNYGAPLPKQISGQVEVRSNGSASGVAGVSVTDGYSVVKTNSRGDYVLQPNPLAVFIYITRPSGYDIVGDWYQPISETVDFNLKPAADDENEFVFVHVTDTHVSSNPQSLSGLSEFVREMNAFSPRPRFVINSGDLLNLSKSLGNSPAEGRADFQRYTGIMNHLEMAHYNVAGDHTDSSHRLDEFPRGDLRCGKPLYWEFLGPHFFSFEFGQLHFVSVDYGYHLGLIQRTVNGEIREYPTLEVQPAHVEWMKQDMAGRGANTFVITTSEGDLGNHCPEFAELARAHDVRLQLVGDTHIVSHKAGAVPYRVGGALAGCWWNPKTKALCPDLSPRGYMIYQARGEEVEFFYKGLGQRVAIVSLRTGAPLRGVVELKAHIVQPRPTEFLEYSLDGSNWKPMSETARPFYRSLHSAMVDTTTLSDGLRKIHVRSSSTGEVIARQIVVANQSDAVSFAGDATLSFIVAPDNGWTTPRVPEHETTVLFNGQKVGALKKEPGKALTFRIPANLLKTVNILGFRFSQRDDGLSLTSPKLTYEGSVILDPRDAAIREIKIAHWGAAAAEWGGYIAGNAEPTVETPFHRKQDVFCFLLDPGNGK